MISVSFVVGVNSLMPIPSTVAFYSGIGKVNHDKLKEFLKEKEKVGYGNSYTFVIGVWCVIFVL
jgi:hypothetical protein